MSEVKVSDLHKALADDALGGAEVVFQSSYDELLDTVASLIATAEASAQGEAGRWIACDERLPGPHVDVYVLGHRGDQHVLRLELDANGKPIGWYPGGWGIGWTNHWAPLLPPPPKAEGKP